MKHLRQKDIGDVLVFLQNLYRLREKEAFTSHLIASLPSLIRAEAYTYNEMNQTQSYASYKLWPKDFTPIRDAQEILGRFSHQIPMLAHWERGDCQALKFSDFLSAREFRKKEIYNKFYRPMRIPHAIGFGISMHRHHLACIANHRNGSDFTERERQVLNLIQPHVHQAYTNSVAVTAMRKAMARLNRTMEHLPFGLLWIDERDRIQWASAPARNLLEEYFGDRKRNSRQLPDQLRRWMRQRSGGLTQLDALPDSLASLAIDRGTRQLHIRLVPDGTHSLMFLEEVVREVPVHCLSHLGLSRRETEVLGWITKGKSNPEIATLLGISVRTIHRHVEHIYVKLGVENRHAAISLAFDVMHRLEQCGVSFRA